MERKRGLFAAVAAALLLLSGCSISEIDDLYSLPQPPNEYLQLQTLIDAEIGAGSEYSAPTEGSLRQTVQLTDLDGDGTNEALAFLRNEQQQPKICIYRKTNGNYAPAATITGEGTAIGRVEYADLDGDGISEIIVSWMVNAELQLMKAYSVKDWAPSELLSASCIDFQIGELEADGSLEVLTLNLGLSGGNVDMYTIDGNRNIAQKTVSLSASLKTADRFRIADIEGGVPAVFVEGQYSAEDSNWLMTDIIVFSGGELKNITLDSTTQDSAAKRQYPIYCTDIDGNGSLDVPFAEKLAGENNYYIFDWYSYDSSGSAVKCASTYHDYTDGWFFEIPEEWRGGIAVRRESEGPGERMLVLSAIDGQSGQSTDRLAIYTFTDENRTERATLDDRFVLMSSGTVVYAAKLYTDGGLPAEDTAKQEIISRFHLIYSEWNTGAL